MDFPGTIQSLFPAPLCEMKCSKEFTEAPIMVTTLQKRILILVFRRTFKCDSFDGLLCKYEILSLLNRHHTMSHWLNLVTCSLAVGTKAENSQKKIKKKRRVYHTDSMFLWSYSINVLSRIPFSDWLATLYLFFFIQETKLFSHFDCSRL